MRLDLFLKISRLMPRRSLAQKFCDAGMVKVNGAAAKSSKEVKLGDEIEITRGSRVTVVRIEKVPNKKQLSKEDAGQLHSIINERVISRDDELS